MEETRAGSPAAGCSPQNTLIQELESSQRQIEEQHRHKVPSSRQPRQPGRAGPAVRRGHARASRGCADTQHHASLCTDVISLILARALTVDASPPKVKKKRRP